MFYKHSFLVFLDYSSIYSWSKELNLQVRYLCKMVLHMFKAPLKIVTDEILQKISKFIERRKGLLYYFMALADNFCEMSSFLFGKTVSDIS